MCVGVLCELALLTRLADEFGSQCVVLSIDTRLGDDDWFVTSHSATRSNSRRCIDWALEGVERGAGEILLNVINADGGESGFALDITGEVARRVQVPVIGSGGAGSPQDFVELFRATEASAGLAATIFHDGRWTPQSLKEELSREGIEVRR